MKTSKRTPVTCSKLLLAASTLALVLLAATAPCAQAALLIQGSNLGCWGVNGNGTINEPFMNNSSQRTLATPVIGLMRFPCRVSGGVSVFTDAQLQSIANTIRNAGLEPLAILTSKNQSIALGHVNALKGIVTYFEFGNENNFFDGWSGAIYAQHWSNDIPVLKAAAPNAKFIGPVGSDFSSSGSTYLSDFLNAIKGNAALQPDIISMHYYSAHGESPAWTATQIMADVTNQMTPGVAALQSTISSIIGSAIPLAITEWNYDAAPENNGSTLDTDSAFMHNYTFAVLDLFTSRGLWGACEYDYGAGAGNGHLDMVSTSGAIKPQYTAFTNWLSLHGSGQPPSITVQPQSQTVNVGANVTFSVTATGTAPLSYQWRFNAVNISGATSSSYTRTNVQASNAGNYSVVVTNAFGSVTSSTAVLTVSTNGSPAIAFVRAVQNLVTAGGPSISTILPNNAGDALVVACRQGTDGTSISNVTDSAGNTYRLVNTSSSGTRQSAVFVATNVAASSSNTVTCTFKSNLGSVEGIVVLEFAGAAPLDGQVTSTNTGLVTSLSSGTITTTKSGDVLIYAVNASVNETTWTAGNGYTIPANGSNARQAVQYFIDGAAGANSTSVSWNAAAAADGEYLALSPTTSSSTNTPPSITTQPQSQTVNVGANVTFTVTAAGTAPLSYQWRFNAANIAGATSSSYTKTNVQLSDAGNYSVVVTNVAGSVTSSNALLTVNSPNTPPSITTQPLSQTVSQGANVTFSVVATGTAPLSYQWRFNAANIAGATSSSYTKSNVQSSDAGSYSVVITNVAGSVTSSNAVLTVNVPPSIATQPQSQTINQGSSVTFTVVATGTTPLSSQWRLNAVSISGATASSYTDSNVQPADAGNYSVVITNVAGSVTSANAVLTVTTNAPVFTYDFNSGLPSGTIVRGNAPTVGVTNAGGFTNSGCMILTRPTGMQTYGQWLVTNDLASGTAVSSFGASFKLYMGHGTGGNAPVPNPGGNGLVFHVGPAPADQVTGSASSWGNGLDVTFRAYNSAPNTYGINIEYNAATNTKPAGSGTIIATSSFIAYFQTNGASDNFSEAVDVNVTLSNAVLNVSCSNAVIGNQVVYNNLTIPAFAPISPGTVAFTASEGAGAHEDAWMDNVKISMNNGGMRPALVMKPLPPEFEPLLLSNGQLILTWTGGGLLQSAPDVNGPWTTIHNASSPYTVPAKGERQFFRIQR